VQNRWATRREFAPLSEGGRPNPIELLPRFGGEALELDVGKVRRKRKRRGSASRAAAFSLACQIPSYFSSIPALVTAASSAVTVTRPPRAARAVRRLDAWATLATRSGLAQTGARLSQHGGGGARVIVVGARHAQQLLLVSKRAPPAAAPPRRATQSLGERRQPP